MAGCITCTTRSPRSTRTHSPASAPSTLTTCPPASLTCCATRYASARVWRFDVPLASTTRSNMSDSPIVLNTLMFWALTSSSASTTTRCSFLMSIRSGVEAMRANIVQHRCRHDLSQARVALGPWRGGQQCAHFRRRNVVRHHLDLDDQAVRFAVDRIGWRPVFVVELLERVAQDQHCVVAAGDAEVRKIENGLPLVPGVETLHLIGPDDEHERCLRSETRA